MESITNNLERPWTIRNGKAVCPVVLMVEGVHVGSGGAVYYSAAVLRASAAKWNRTSVLVTLDHPQVDGMNQSVYFNAETMRTVIGLVKNVRYSEAKKGLCGEIHINSTHPQLGTFQQYREVSIGVFPTIKEETGIWNEEVYSYVAETMEPDHLALLTADVGACSFEDGCGVRSEHYQAMPEPLYPPILQLTKTNKL
ncbi:MAG: hypothetical protein WDZ47_00975 [Bacteroidales bacterium]